MIKILQGDCLEKLRELPECSVHCCVTSPPYWGLRDYGVAGQIGLEKTPEEYVAKMVEVFREVRRVLREDGTLWLNLGDTYAANFRWGGSDNVNSKQWSNRGTQAFQEPNTGRIHPTKPKDLVGIPWRVAFALQQPYQVPTCVNSEIDRAWLAAMFDGEGCIGIRRFDSYRKEKQQVYQDGFVIYTVVTNNDVELLDRCVSVTRLGRPALKQAANSTDNRGIVSRRDSYGWRLDGNPAVDVIRAIYPYLIAKRKQACIAFTLDCLNKNGHGSRSVPQEVQEKKRYLWGLIKACNQRQSVTLPDWIIEPRLKVEPGWYLRSDIIWHKPNPMPESVTDRPTKSHEYIFLLSKNATYFYDAEAIKEESSGLSGERFGSYPADTMRHDAERERPIDNGTRNKRDVWTVPSQSYPESHFATFPEDLIKPCILAGTSAKGCCPKCGAPWERVVERNGGLGRRDSNAPNDGPRDAGIWSGRCGEAENRTIGWKPTCRHPDILADGIGLPPIPCTVLDPFGGSGTTGQVALELGRKAILIELNPKYIPLIEKRTFVTPGFQLA